MDKNKTGKYLKYAIGEIILVVIGILIALSINNWNENRKNSIKETQFLESFKLDLLTNELELKRVINKSERTQRKADSILMAQSGEIEVISPSELLSLIMSITGFTVYNSHEATIQDILGSGRLGIIKNDSIRLVISSWQSNLNTIREWEKMGKKSSVDYSDYRKTILDIYKGRGVLILTKDDITKLYKDRLFLNLVNGRISITLTLNNLYEKELAKLEALLKLIDKSL